MKGQDKDYLQSIIDGLEDELMVIDRDYRIIQANEAVLTKHGKRRDEVIGEYCYHVSHGLPDPCRPPHHGLQLRHDWSLQRMVRWRWADRGD